MGSPEVNNRASEELSDTEDLAENDGDLNHLFHDIFADHPGPSPQLKERIKLVIQMQRDLILLENKQTLINPLIPQPDKIDTQA